MSTYKNLMTVCAVAALALGLAACGGGGSSTPTAMQTPDPMPTPMPDPEPDPDPVAVTVPDAMYLDEDNMPVAGTYEIAAGGSTTSGGVMFACAEDGDACEVTVAADGSVMATGGTVTASLTEDAVAQVAAAKRPGMIADRDRLVGQDRALEGATNIGAGTGNGPTEANIIINRAAGAAASVRVTGYAASETAAADNGSWAGTRLMRSVTGATQHLVIYTDIGPPTRIQFYNWDGVATTPFLYASSLDSATTPFVEEPGTTDVPTLALAGALLSRANLDADKFNSPGPSAGGTVTQRFPTATAAGTSLTFQGNFNGAAGTYTCSGATGGACVMNISPTGTYTPRSGETWTFTPEVSATAWRRDTDFISFGWWLHEPTSANGAYRFQYYADGIDYTAPTSPLSPGRATYNGRAAGRYVVQEVGDSGVTGGHAGAFTAAATLEASFSPTANSISGRIHDFMGENGAMSDWEVTLHRKALGVEANLVGTTAFPAATQPNPALPGYNGVTATMGDQTAQGDWTGQYFGNEPRKPDAYPTGVGGTFQADNEAVSIAGAFGARR